jgi:hypothetical protein
VNMRLVYHIPILSTAPIAIITTGRIRSRVAADPACAGEVFYLQLGVVTFPVEQDIRFRKLYFK